MAYINILEQPQVNEVDSLLGIKDDKVVQIDSKDSCLSGLSNLTEVQKQQVREDINALEDEAGVIDTEHLATGSVTKEKLDSGLRNSIGTKAIRINYGDVEAAEAALKEYNKDPNKTVVLVNYNGIRIPATVSATFILALVTEGNDERKLLYRKGKWDSSVVFDHSSVLYDKHQSLTDSEQKTARDNIGIPDINMLKFVYKDLGQALGHRAYSIYAHIQVDYQIPEILIFRDPNYSRHIYLSRVPYISEIQYNALMAKLEAEFPNESIGEICCVYAVSREFLGNKTKQKISVGDSIKDFLAVGIIAKDPDQIGIYDEKLLVFDPPK